MPFDATFEEQKVQAALQLLRKNPGITIADVARQTRAIYHRCTRRLKGIPASNTRGGHNVKMNWPQNQAIKDHLLFCYYIGRNAQLPYVIECANRLLTWDGVLDSNSDIATVSRQ